MIWHKYKIFRDFGWIIGVIFLCIGLYPILQEKQPFWFLTTLGLVVISTSFIYPPLLKPY